MQMDAALGSPGVIDRKKGRKRIKWVHERAFYPPWSAEAVRFAFLSAMARDHSSAP